MKEVWVNIWGMIMPDFLNYSGRREVDLKTVQYPALNIIQKKDGLKIP